MRQLTALATAVLSSATLALPIAAQTVVTPTDPQGWGIYPFGTPTPYGAMSTTFPHLGNGSAEILLYDQGNSSLQYWYELPTPTSLGSLSALSWDWYVSSTSTTPAFTTPAFGMYVYGTAVGAGYLIWEGAYNGTSPVAPQDQWVSSDMLSANFWMDNGSGVGSCAPASAYQTIGWFLTECFGGQATVLGFSPFLGNGYDGTTFHGAFDNVAYAFDDGSSGHFNFEASATSTVPEPATMTLLATGLAGMAAARRKKRQG